MSTWRIDSAATINEVIALDPNTIAVFNAFGIDACCGGSESLEHAARRDGVELAALMAALEAVTEPATPAVEGR